MINTYLTKKTRGQKHDIIDEVHSYNILLETREIFLYGDVDAENNDSGSDFRFANKFIKNLRFLEQSGDDIIVVHQYNPGGDWESGMAVYDAIKLCSCHIIFIMHGMAYSMGSVIPQAADTKIIMPNCLFMIHQGNFSINGTYKQALSYNEMHKQLNDIMLEMYTKSCFYGPYFQSGKYDEIKVKKFIKAKMDQKEDWWLSAQDAVKYGFADGIFGEPGYETIEIIKENIVNA